MSTGRWEGESPAEPLFSRGKKARPEPRPLLTSQAKAYDMSATCRSTTTIPKVAEFLWDFSTLLYCHIPHHERV